MYILTEFIGVISEVLIIWLFIQGFFSRKQIPSWITITSYAVYGLGLSILSLIESAVYARIIFCGLGIILLAYYLYESNLFQAIFTGCFFCAIYMMTDVFIYLLASVQGINTSLIMEHSISRCVFILTTHVLLLVVVSIVLLFAGKKRGAITVPFMLVLSPGYVISILLGFSFCQYLEATGEELPLPFLFASIALLYMNIVLVFYAEQSKQSADSRREIEIAEHHYAMQEQYYEQLRSEQTETRALFHDISKHLQAMQALVDKNKSEHAQELLDETKLLYHNIGNVVDVGNDVVSILLNEYKNRAQEYGIEFILSVSIPNELCLSAVDCYIILGNTLDNAIEGALSAAEGNRRISLQLRQHQQTLFYKVENTCSSIHANRKRDKNHGFGLRNVKKCITKYSGDMVTTFDDSTYIFMARLNCIR